MEKINEKMLQEGAKGYLVCYSEACPQREKCLRWLAGPHAEREPMVLTVVNLLNSSAETAQCRLFRSCEPVAMVRGMRAFYEEMPARIAAEIRNRLLASFGNGTYYQYRNGVKPITPAVRRRIERTCVECGWRGPLVFDSASEEYEW